MVMSPMTMPAPGMGPVAPGVTGSGGPETAEGGGYERVEGDLFPTTEQGYEDLKAWCTRAWAAAQQAKRPYEKKWKRYYRLWMMYVGPRRPGEWRSRVFMPESFQTVETILPRLISALPDFEATARGPEDEDNAEILTRELQYAQDESNLHLAGVDMNRDRLMYGTGIFKICYKEIEGYGREAEPAFETITDMVQRPVIDPETQAPLRNPDGEIVTESIPVSAQVPAGFRTKRTKVIHYAGPVAYPVDPFHFFVAPESQNIDEARYIIHRTYVELKEFMEMVAKGVYHWPDDLDPESLQEEKLFTNTHDDPDTVRRNSVDLGPGVDPTRKMVELLEFQTKDGRVITMLQQRAVVRHQVNPYDHGQKTYAVFYDYKPPHEFWGRGEIEIIEGLQDLINTLVNQRIDNVRLGMDQGYAVNSSQLKDPNQLKRRPGQVVEVLGDGMQPSDVIHPLPTTEVTSSAFAEADQAKQWSERTSGSSAYQQGLDTSSMNDTATGVAMITEQGSNRFAVKSKIDEIDPWRRTARQYGAIIQQYRTDVRSVRLLGPDGAAFWETVDPLSLMGSFDFRIESTSAIQSETIKREQAISLFRELAPLLANPNPIPPPAIELIKDVLESFGHKNVDKYLQQAVPMMQPGMLQQVMGQAPAPPGAAPAEVPVQ